MQNDITYFQADSNLEYIYYHNTAQSYPMHTHASHVTMGYILTGAVRMLLGNQEYLYCAGESFCVMPDVPHAIEPVQGGAYSMICVCVHVMQSESIPGNAVSYPAQLKQTILDMPEHILSVEDLAESVGISPYHMIRQFKKFCGLTPHQFQIQCRIRKAQKLLAEGKSMTEVAYATGFCDQSHFNRCFRKIVRLTPGEYRQCSYSFSRMPE